MVINNFQILIQAFTEVFAEEFYHRGAVVEGVVVAHTVGEFDVDGRVACLHQLEVDNEASGSAVAVDEGVYRLERDMQVGELFDDISLI